MAKTSNPTSSTTTPTAAPSTTKGAPTSATSEDTQTKTVQSGHTPAPRVSGLTTSETDTSTSPAVRKVALVNFAKPVKPFDDVSSAYQLKTDDRLKLSVEGGMIIGTYAGKTAGTVGAVGWPINGDFVREIRFADVPGSLEPTPAGMKNEDARQVETPQGPGAPRATSGEAVTNGGVPGTGKNLPPKDGQSREDSKQLPSEENDSREQVE